MNEVVIPMIEDIENDGREALPSVLNTSDTFHLSLFGAIRVVDTSTYRFVNYIIIQSTIYYCIYVLEFTLELKLKPYISAMILMF